MENSDCHARFSVVNWVIFGKTLASHWKNILYLGLFRGVILTETNGIMLEKQTFSRWKHTFSVCRGRKKRCFLWVSVHRGLAFAGCVSRDVFECVDERLWLDLCAIMVLFWLHMAVVSVVYDRAFGWFRWFRWCFLGGLCVSAVFCLWVFPQLTVEFSTIGAGFLLFYTTLFAGCIEKFSTFLIVYCGKLCGKVLVDCGKVCKIAENFYGVA